MRTFLCPRAMSLGMIILAATALLMWSGIAFANQDRPAISSSNSGGSTSETPPLPLRKPSRRLTVLRSRLDQKDHIVAMRALQLALSQVEDGGTFVWRKRSRSLKGMIKPSKAFRNSDGRICRHVIYALSLGRYIKQIEGIACRQIDGRWQL